DHQCAPPQFPGHKTERASLPTAEYQFARRSDRTEMLHRLSPCYINLVDAAKRRNSASSTSIPLKAASRRDLSKQRDRAMYLCWLNSCQSAFIISYTIFYLTCDILCANIF